MTPSQITRPLTTVAGDRVALSVMGLTVGLWTVLGIWALSPYSVYLGHGELADASTVAGLLPLASLFFLGWTVMVAAMSLPTTLPLAKEYQRMASVIPPARHSLSWLVAGSVAVWAPFGILVYLLDVGIHRAAVAPPLQGNEWLLGFSSLVLAGVYQFTRMKSNFLTDCCFPGDYLQSRWREHMTNWRAFRLGLGYGKVSVGSHWALMLLMFSLGLGSLPSMALLGLAMGTEHQSKLASRARTPIGAMVLLAALFFGIVYGRI